ncbi:unnamed protein product [Chrysoparadoxa australica]
MSPEEGCKARESVMNKPGAPPRKLRHLVLDANALIKQGGSTLAQSAEQYWTTSSVLSEIRDKKARAHLDMLPFELKLKEPNDECMKHVTLFAKQTGDLRALSVVDLGVIALAYQLEKEETGGKYLREQGPKGPHGPQPTSGSGPESPKIEGTQDSKADQQQRGEAELLVVDAESSDGGAGQEEQVGGDSNEQEQPTDEPQARGGAIAEDGTAAEAETSSGAGSDDDWEPEPEGEIGSESGSEDDEEVEGGFELLEDEFPGLSIASFPAASSDAAETVAKSITTTPASPTEAPTAMSWSAKALQSRDEPLRVAVKEESSKVKVVNPGAGALSAEPITKAATQGVPDAAGSGTSRILVGGGFAGVTGGNAGDGDAGEHDDGVGWVNPDNIAMCRAHGIGLTGPSQQIVAATEKPPAASSIPAAAKSAEPEKTEAEAAEELRQLRKAKKRAKKRARAQCKAGCVTTDFAMQNVLLHMGMTLLSLDGMRVSRVKQWVLRCAACFRTTTEMERLFCGSCGSSTLERVACSIDARTGATKLHLRKHPKHNLRGTKYSLPKAGPKGGRFQGDLLLREDQLLTGIWAQKAKRSTKNVRSMFDEQITMTMGMNVTKSADVKVGYGRKNPNAQRGRERRGKKRTSS